MFPSGLAAQEGTIQKGDEVLSINGKSLKGAMHSDALAILRQAREPRQAVVVTQRPAPTPEAAPTLRPSPQGPTPALAGAGKSPTWHVAWTRTGQERVRGSGQASLTTVSPSNGGRGRYGDADTGEDAGGAGLQPGRGAGLAAGGQAPHHQQGFYRCVFLPVPPSFRLAHRWEEVPVPESTPPSPSLGAASGLESMQPGDEVLQLAGKAVQGLTRFEAWSLIKTLPDGPVPVLIRRKSPRPQGTPSPGNP